MDKNTKKTLYWVFVVALGVSVITLLIAWFGMFQTFLLGNALSEAASTSVGKAISYIKWTFLSMFLLIGLMMAGNIFSLFTKDKLLRLLAIIFSGLVLVFAVVFLFVSIKYIRVGDDVVADALTAIASYQSAMIEIIVSMIFICLWSVLRFLALFGKKEMPENVIAEKGEIS